MEKSEVAIDHQITNILASLNPTCKMHSKKKVGGSPLSKHKQSFAPPCSYLQNNWTDLPLDIKRIVMTNLTSVDFKKNYMVAHMFGEVFQGIDEEAGTIEFTAKVLDATSKIWNKSMHLSLLESDRYVIRIYKEIGNVFHNGSHGTYKVSIEMNLDVVLNENGIEALHYFISEFGGERGKSGEQDADHTLLYHGFTEVLDRLKNGNTVRIKYTGEISIKYDSSDVTSDFHIIRYHDIATIENSEFIEAVNNLLDNMARVEQRDPFVIEEAYNLDFVDSKGSAVEMLTYIQERIVDIIDPEFPGFKWNVGSSKFVSGYAKHYKNQEYKNLKNLFINSQISRVKNEIINRVIGLPSLPGVTSLPLVPPAATFSKQYYTKKELDGFAKTLTPKQILHYIQNDLQPTPAPKQLAIALKEYREHITKEGQQQQHGGGKKR